MENKLLKLMLLLMLGFIIFELISLFLILKNNKLERGNLSGYGDYVVDHTFLNATTTNATSTPSLDAENAKKITFFFQRGDTTGQGNTGTTTFSVQVSNDDSNWITYNKLIDNLTNSNSQQLTRVASAILSAAANYNNATGTKTYSMDMENDTFKYLRCVAFEQTDGEHTCKARIQY